MKMVLYLFYFSVVLAVKKWHFFYDACTLLITVGGQNDTSNSSFSLKTQRAKSACWSSTICTHSQSKYTHTCVWRGPRSKCNATKHPLTQRSVLRTAAWCSLLKSDRRVADLAEGSSQTTVWWWLCCSHRFDGSDKADVRWRWRRPASAPREGWKIKGI